MRSLVFSVKPDFAFGFIGWGKELANGIEDNFELIVVVTFECADFTGEFFDRESHLAESDEGPHDANVHCDGTRAIENTGEHGHAFLSKGVGEISTTAPSCV